MGLLLSQLLAFGMWKICRLLLVAFAWSDLIALLCEIFVASIGRLRYMRFFSLLLIDCQWTLNEDPKLEAKIENLGLRGSGQRLRAQYFPIQVYRTL